MQFPEVLFDEGGQATEVDTISAVVGFHPPRVSDRLIIFGDHLQLPPTVNSSDALKLGMQISLFERLYDDLSFTQKAALLGDVIASFALACAAVWFIVAGCAFLSFCFSVLSFSLKAS